MNKVYYHKMCKRHKPVEKAKRMITKIYRDFEDLLLREHVKIELTGVESIDLNNINYITQKQVEQLSNHMQRQIAKNKEFLPGGQRNEDYEFGFWVEPMKERMLLIEAFNDVFKYMQNNYPEPVIKKTTPYVFVGSTAKEKRKEAGNHFNLNKVTGFCQEYYLTLKDGNKKKLFPLTLGDWEFEHAVEVYAEFI